MAQPSRNLQNSAFILVPCLALTLLVGDSSHVEPLFVQWTYYFLLALVVSWVAVYLRCARDLTKAAAVNWVKENKAGIIIALAVAACAALAVEPALRVLADETNLLGTSKNFFVHKTATFTVTGKHYYGNFWDAADGAIIDRRPALYPFLVSLLHVMRGYSHTNAFLLNLLALPVFVFTSYRLAKSVGGEVFGVASALLVAAHPITLISARSGGFDFLTTVFSVIVLKSFFDHCRAPSADRLAVLWVNLCMFAELRYETGLFLFPVVAFLLLFRLARLDYLGPYRVLYALSPVFLLPRLWQAIVRGNVPEQDPGATTFSAGNFAANALDYLRPLVTPFDQHVSHSAFIIGLGIVGCILAVRLLVVAAASTNRPVYQWRFGGMVVGWMALQLFIVFTYVWGRPLHPASARLIIAIDTFFSFAAAWTLTVLFRRTSRFVTIAVSAVLFVMSVPVGAQHRLLNELTLTREAATAWRFFESLHEKRIVIVAERPGLFTVMNYGSVGFDNARNDPAVLAGFEQHLYYDIYLVQQIDLATGRPLPQHEMWPERPKEAMLEFLNDASASIRISRLLR